MKRLLPMLLPWFCALGCETDQSNQRMTRAPQPTASEVFMAIQSRFRQLRLGMLQSDVQQILGPPASVHQMSSMSFWNYFPEFGGASVTFNSYGSVDGWNELNWTVMESTLRARYASDQADRDLEMTRLLLLYQLSK